MVVDTERSDFHRRSTRVDNIVLPSSSNVVVVVAAAAEAVGGALLIQDDIVQTKTVVSPVLSIFRTQHVCQRCDVAGKCEVFGD